MADFTLRSASPADGDALCDLFCVSMNFWYRSHGKGDIFPTGPDGVLPFVRTYDLLDPGCCVVAEDRRTRRLMGASFYHPRETHVSLGMLAVHPNHFSAGVGKALVRYITDLSEKRQVPTRLVSSAHNLDSYSLYTRSGFVPRMLFQDVLVTCPAESSLPLTGFEARRTRPAEVTDVERIAALEREVAGVYRPDDWQHFAENRLGYWSLSVAEDDSGRLVGAMASVREGGMCIVGPGVARDRHAAASVLRAQLEVRRGITALLLLPADQGELVKLVYGWGGKNIEMHVLQVRGEWAGVRGLVFPSFLPESL